MLSKTKKSALTFISFTLFISSCGYESLEKEYPLVNEIKKGEKFCVILPENHNELSFWHFHETGLKFTQSINSVWHGNEKGIYFNFSASAIGTDTLHFFKRQQQDTIQKEMFIVKVVN